VELLTDEQQPCHQADKMLRYVFNEIVGLLSKKIFLLFLLRHFFLFSDTWIVVTKSALKLIALPGAV